MKATNTELVMDAVRNPRAAAFEKALRQKIVGQDEALTAMVETYETILAGMSPVNRPLGTMLFMGPTGTGKTRIVEAAAEVLFGDEHAVMKVNCGEFQHGHEISKLVGSPPGYLGHAETPAFFAQVRIDSYQTEQDRFTFVLFDEIEKAHGELWNFLLGILDKGELTLGDNRRIDMSRCIIIMTSNAGASAMSELTDGVRMGFSSATQLLDDRHDKKVEEVAINAVKRKFTPEFFNRLDKLVVFKTLRPEHIENILEIELGKVQQRILQMQGNTQFVFTCDESVKNTLLREGFDAHYGARALKRVIERRLVLPLARLVSSGRVKLGDLVGVTHKEGAAEFTFTKLVEGALIPVLLQKKAHGAAASLAESFVAATNRRTTDPTTVPVRMGNIRRV